MIRNFVKEIADKELVEKLINCGYGKFVRALQDPSVYTKNGRLNKSALCRLLNWKAVQVQAALQGCRDLLGDL